VKILCPSAVVGHTLTHLQEGGHRGCECVVLWLGRRDGDRIIVQEAYRPIHTAEADIFWIASEGMDALKSYLRQKRYMVAAQVHSHPGQAFHSAADDRWAIVRHHGALSLVLPAFALQTTPASFLQEAKVYQLAADDEWVEVPIAQVGPRCLASS